MTIEHPIRIALPARLTGRALPSVPVRVRDVMTLDPVSVEPGSTVKEVAQVLLSRDIGSVPVVDMGDLLIGVVSEADLISREGYPTVRAHHLSGLITGAVVEHRHHWAARADGITAGEIMTSTVVTCEPAEPLAGVVRRMLEHDVRSLPVVDDGHLVGVVSRRDCLALFDRPDPDVAASVERLLADPLWMPEEHAIRVRVLDGVVTLTGSVRYHGEVTLAGDVVGNVPGVVEIVNQLGWRESDLDLAVAGDSDWRAG